MIGFDTIMDYLKTFPQKVEKRILRRGLGKAAGVLKRYAKAEAPTGKTGVLKRAISARIGKVQAQVYVKFGGKRKEADAWYNHLVVKGTRAHSVRRKASLANNKLQDKRPFHPGSKPNDYMDRALLSGRDEAVKAMAQFMADAIKKELSK